MLIVFTAFIYNGTELFSKNRIKLSNVEIIFEKGPSRQDEKELKESNESDKKQDNEIKSPIENSLLEEIYDKEAQCHPFNAKPNQFKVDFNGVSYPKYIPLRDNQTFNFDCMNKNKKSKVILFWTPLYDFKDFYYGLGTKDPFIKHKCPVYNCELTNDRSRVNDSDLIIFSFANQIDSLPNPAWRKPNQRWVFVLIESPVHVPGSRFISYNNLFNMSVTYKLSSDFMSHYSYETYNTWQLNENFDENQNFYQDKTEFAAIIVSNCGGSSGRLAYINEMRKYVKVDIYGNCGQACPKTFSDGTPGDCKEIIAKKYKFFLSFENSICDEYITEKFFIALKFNIIPVVLGGGNYENYIPKSGFINVLDYSSPKELSNYLKYLDSNQTAYNSYFKWKKYVKKYADTLFAGEVCEFCVRLNVDTHLGLRQTVIKDLNEFWNAKDCKGTNQFPQLTKID